MLKRAKWLAFIAKFSETELKPRLSDSKAPDFNHYIFLWSVTLRAMHHETKYISGSSYLAIEKEFVQLLSHVRHFVIPWTAACQASLSFTITQSLLKLMSVELAMPFNYLILCHCLLLLPSVFPSIRVFSNESAPTSGGQNIGDSASALALLMNIQGWFPLGVTGLISFLSSNSKPVFSSTRIWKHPFFSVQASL